MTRAKGDEGLGVYVLQTLNVALLTNMETRILSELNALWVRILKGDFSQTVTSWSWIWVIMQHENGKACWLVGMY